VGKYSCGICLTEAVKSCNIFCGTEPSIRRESADTSKEAVSSVIRFKEQADQDGSITLDPDDGDAVLQNILSFTNDCSILYSNRQNPKKIEEWRLLGCYAVWLL
jgi:hypothetical protein